MKEPRSDAPLKRRDEKLHIENPRSFMLIIDILCFLLIIMGIFLGVRFILNEIFKSRYNKQVYSEKYIEDLTGINFPESYLPYYNLGNVHYQNGEYDDAIANYKTALEISASHRGHKECDIRVNLALAMLAKIDWQGMSGQKDYQRAIRQLKAARNVLTEEGCANPDDPNGHDADAEQLKADIDKILEQMQKNSDSSDSDEDNQNDDNQQGQDDKEQQNPKDSKREDELKDALDEQKKNSMKERQQAEQDKNNQENGGGYNEYDGKTW